MFNTYLTPGSKQFLQQNGINQRSIKALYEIKPVKANRNNELDRNYMQMRKQSQALPASHSIHDVHNYIVGNQNQS